MRIWIDLANSPHVPFFGALIPEMEARGHEVELTARDFAQTVEMARARGMAPEVFGGGSRRGLTRKAGDLAVRAFALARWARGRGFDLAVGHNSYAQVLAARLAGLRSVTLMDYEHQPANALAFRLASRVVVPAAFPEDALRHAGAPARKVRRYAGIKEDAYLADFEPDPEFAPRLEAEYGVRDEDVLVVVRPPARDALYHRFENTLFDELLADLEARPGVKLMLLARSEAQREAFAAGHAGAAFIAPRAPVDGANLVARADLVVSAGGTMNREAAAVGTPAATVYAGRWAAVDECLVREGRLLRVRTREDIRSLRVERKRAGAGRRALHVRAEILESILGA